MNLYCPSYIDETCRGIYSHDRNLLLDAFSTHISAKNAHLFIMLSLFAKLKRKYTIIWIFLTLLFQLKKPKINKKLKIRCEIQNFYCENENSKSSGMIGSA